MAIPINKRGGGREGRGREGRGEDRRLVAFWSLKKNKTNYLLNGGKRQVRGAGGRGEVSKRSGGVEEGTTNRLCECKMRKRGGRRREKENKRQSLDQNQDETK